MTEHLRDDDTGGKGGSPMPSDTFAAGVEAAARLAEAWREENKAQAAKDRKNGNVSMADRLDGAAVECNAIAEAIRNLTPTASEATAIGAGEGLSARALHWRLMGLAASLRSDQFDEDDASARDIEEAARRLAAASPKVASDTAPGVETLALRAIKAVTATAKDGAAGLSRIMVIARAAGVHQPYSELLTDPDVALIVERPRTEWAHLFKPDTAGCCLPPAGWYCTRERGHSGPCAALAASPTASDTDTAIPGGHDLSTAEGRWRYYRSPDSVPTAASPKPDTDTPPSEPMGWPSMEAFRAVYGSPEMRDGMQDILEKYRLALPDTDTPVDPGVEEAIAELVYMLQIAANEEGVTVFDHSPEEIGLHVMENHAAILAAIKGKPAA